MWNMPRIILTPKHSFNCNKAAKVQQFGFMRIDEALHEDSIETDKFIHLRTQEHDDSKVKVAKELGKTV